MDKKSKDTSTKKRVKKKAGGRKLTAAERRRIEREQRAKRYDDDPLAAFDTDPIRYTTDSDYLLYTDDNSQAKPDNKQPEKQHKKEPEITPPSRLTSKQRKLRRTLSYIAVFLMIIGAAVILSLTVMFRTTEIKVEAEDLPYSDEEIIETSGLTYKDNIFLAKRKAAEKNLVETYPYVEGVEVTFRIPGTQIIKIETAIPSYQVQFSGGFSVVSGNGRILEVNAAQKNEIPLLKGIKLKQTQPGEYITFEKQATKQILDEVVKNINENEMPNINGIDISDSANIELNFDNRITILLGLPEDVGYKLRTAKAIISQQLNASDKGTLDVSICNTDRRSSYFTPIYSETSPLPAPKNEEESSAVSRNEPETDDAEYLDDIID